MAKLDEIVKVAIHPAIGIARVGNSPTDHFFGSEVPGEAPSDPNLFRDAQGRIKRQAVRFRIYGLNQRGEVVRELTAKDPGVEIAWKVHVANTKAAWFQFHLAFDIPAAKGEITGVKPLTSALRNSAVTGADRGKLVIDPGPRTIQGAGVNHGGGDSSFAFDTGTFFGKPVYLGELRTDDEGRLTFLGGRGQSQPSDDKHPLKPGEFANNDDWHDDISDGPVDATVRIDNRVLEATGAWVIVAPPDYAPGILAVVTGYDLVSQAATELDASSTAGRPSFAREILPLLVRLVNYQWVNAGFFQEFGWGSPVDFGQPDLARRLGDPSDASLPLRLSVFRRFRDPNAIELQANAWPSIYGDAVEFSVTAIDPLGWMPILKSQYESLRRWAEGDFDVDRPKGWAEMTAAERAVGLDRAALEHSIGGPFHPGAEFTWPLRQPILYDAPFRIKRRQGPPPDLGPQLTSALALMAGGPLDGSGPGDLSRWMAVPWQADTASCLSAYRPYAGEYLPTFWPARVPNDVLTQEQYGQIMDPSSSLSVTEAAFDPKHSEKWLRGIVYPYQKVYPPMRITDPLPTRTFVDKWWEVGIVVRRPGPSAPSVFPEQFWVESGRSIAQTRALSAQATAPLWTEDPRASR
jgi:L-Lysine epsilon oxidase N-terminal/L-lysine epsilon oxidase C-terminal domain